MRRNRYYINNATNPNLSDKINRKSNSSYIDTNKPQIKIFKKISVTFCVLADYYMRAKINPKGGGAYVSEKTDDCFAAATI